MKRREKSFWIVIGVLFLVGFLALIPFNGEICAVAERTGNNTCTDYHLPYFLAFKIGRILDAFGVAITALATIAIATFTLTLKRATDRLWKAGNDQLGLLGRSVDISERALTELEAPFITVKITDPGVSRSYGEIGHTFVTLTFCISNFGRTPARILEIVDRVTFIEKNDGLPRKIFPDEATRNEMPWGVLAPPQGESQPFKNNLFAYTMGEMVNEPLPLKSKNLFFYGFVRYADLFGNVFRVGYCFVFDVFSERWLLMGSDDYNYRKKEQDGLSASSGDHPRAETRSHLPKYLQDSFPMRLEEKLDKSLREAGS
jgi:hypothetical protein